MVWITPQSLVRSIIVSGIPTLSPKRNAVADFYALSKRNDYIKVKAIAQNIAFEAETPYGSLEITINLSKPEKILKTLRRQTG